MSQQSPFARKANNQDENDFELPPAGAHPAYVVALVDLGTHEQEYNGEKLPDKRELLLCWELCGTKTNAGLPFVVGQDYKDTLGKKANWRKLIEGWRGRAFAADELFDPYVLLGQKCVVNLSIGLSKNDKKFSDVTSASMPMKGLTFPAQHHLNFFFHLSVWDPSQEMPLPAWLPRIYKQTVAEKIKGSKEYLEMERQGKFVRTAQSAPTNGTYAGTVTSRHPDPRSTEAAPAAEPAATYETEPCPF